MRSATIKYRGNLYRLYQPKSNVREFRTAVNRLWSALQKVLAFLKPRGIQPVVVGGLAVQHHGLERLTDDIDILIDRIDYDRLVDEGKIKFGQLKLLPGVEVDVLTEGKDKNPGPEYVRDADTIFPTFAGLMFLKLKASRAKDIGDVVELIKARGFDPQDRESVLAFLPTAELKEKFLGLWATAEQEQRNRENVDA